MRRTLVVGLLAAVTLISISLRQALAGDPSRIPSDYPKALGDGPNVPVAADYLRGLPGALAAGPAGPIGSIALPGNQAETSIAASGSSVVVGYNDDRGAFGLGIMYSTDGGASFSDAGQLPVPAGGFSSGDPAVGVWTPSSGPPVFYCATINTDATNVSGLYLYRSTTGGATWSGPFLISSTAFVGDFPDREAMAVDPETGRVLISWAHFSSTVTIRVVSSDNAATGSPPTWSAATIVGSRGQDGEATTILADPTSGKVYLGWLTYWSGPNRGVAIATSSDNGTTWSAPHDVLPLFWSYLSPYGFDRWLWSFSGSSMALNPTDGGIEMVFAASVDGTPAHDFGDIYYRRSTDGGTSWSVPVALNVFPGTDRPQCLPSVSTTQEGRIDVYWYDLSAGSGLDDYTDIFYAFSTDHGASWSSPVPVTSSPFHNESKNNFGAPQQGDYLGAYSALVAAGHDYAAAATFSEPSATASGPDGLTYAATGIQVAPLRVRPGSIGIVDHGCGTDDGVLVAKESAELTIPLQNIGRTSLTGISAVLSSTTPGVSVEAGARTYGTIASGASGTSSDVYRVTLSTGYACGAPARFRLDIAASGVAPTWIEFPLPTGIPVAATTLLSENFDGVVAPALPAGWSAITVRGGPASPWVTTTSSPASPPNAAFDPEATTNNFERLQAPVLSVPMGTSYLEVTFDTQYSLSQYDSRFAPDGFTFDYQLDGAGGSHFSVGDATEFSYRYTHNIQRQSGSAGDRSGWSGSGTPYHHVRIVIPGLAGHTMTPRFHLTTAGVAGGTGAWVDNVSIKAVTLGCGTCIDSLAIVASAGFGGTISPAGTVTVGRGTNASFTITPYANHAIANVIVDGGSVGPAPSYTFTNVQSAHTIDATFSGPLAVDDPSGVALRLGPALPNPVVNGTRIAVSLPAAAPARLTVVDIRGRTVATLLDRMITAGDTFVRWDGRDSFGTPVASGVYFYRLQVPGRALSRRLIVLR